MTLPGNRKLVCVGSYRLTGRRLGKGNFAKVEEAVHTLLKTKVALKVMNISEIKEEYVIRNLHREARLMSQLNHPCITTLFETMQNGSVYYLVTELVGGGDLCTYIKSQRGGKLEERLTKIFGRQLVSAVAYMHGMGIVHRDLKMENIMLNDTKTHLKIVDFGLSNFWSVDNPLRTHCGSPEYAAPELFITGQIYGPQVDLWSLGVILYGMVLGQLPFLTSRDSRISSQERRKHLLQQINRGLAPAHRKALASFSIEFRAMLARLLMPDPAKRINVLDLIKHPWLTDRNRKPLRVTGLNDLDTTWKTILLKEVGKLFRAEPNHVVTAIRNEPFGSIGGVYNILTYNHCQQVELTTKDSLSTQSHPTRPATTTGTVTHYAGRYLDVHRPVTASCTRHQSTATPPKIDVRKNIRDWNNDIHGAASRLRIIGTRNITKTHGLRSENTSKPSTRHSERIQNLAAAKKAADALLQRRTKSEPIQNPINQKTTNAASSKKPTEQRAVKRKSEQRQHQQRIPRPAGNKNPTNDRKPSSATPSRTTSRGTPPRPQSSQMSGRCIHQPPVTKTRPTVYQAPETRTAPIAETSIGRRLLNEPIARCIAGYVGKYMNGTKLRTKNTSQQFRWIKDFAAFNHPGMPMMVETN